MKKVLGIVLAIVAAFCALMSGFALFEKPTDGGYIAMFIIFFVLAFLLFKIAIKNLNPKEAKSSAGKKWLSFPWFVQTLIATLIVFALGGAMGASASPMETQQANQAPPVEQTQQTEAAPEPEPVAVEGTLKANFIDVGQGDSEFLELPDGKTMLIDAGEESESATVAGYIKDKGYTKIDYVIATHPHSDHIGGLPGIISSFEIGEVWAPKVQHDTQTFESFLDSVSNKGLSINTATAGKTIYDANGCKIEILSPSENASFDDLNDWSVILKVTFGEKTFLFTGDAGTNVISSSNPGDIDVLKVGHHGSDTSTTSGLISSLSPSYAVISCGAGNSYGHPDQSTLDALNGVELYRTDTDGTIVATCDGNSISWEKNITAPRADTTTSAAAASAAAAASSASSSNNSSSSNEKSSSVSSSDNASSTGSSDTTVYITKTGAKYHLSGCSSLSKSKIPISLSEAKAQGYEPCKKCHPPA